MLPPIYNSWYSRHAPKHHRVPMNILQWLPSTNIPFNASHSHHDLLQRGVIVAVGSYAIVKLSGHLLRQYYFVPKYTFLNDLKNLGKDRSNKLKGRVVICGGRLVSTFLVQAQPSLSPMDAASPVSYPPQCAQTTLTRCWWSNPKPG